jgi:hypothetical protein
MRVPSPAAKMIAVKELANPVLPIKVKVGLYNKRVLRNDEKSFKGLFISPNESKP